MPATKAKKTESSSTAPSPEPTSTAKKNPFDRNGDNRLDLDDLLIGLRQAVQWVISWRGVMSLSLLFTLFSAYLNVMSWIAVLAAMGGMAPIAGVLTWGFIQMQGNYSGLKY